MEAIPVKTLQYLGESAGSSPRLIVAGKFLKDGRLLLIDRKNSVLLITNTNDEKIQEIDIARPDKTIKPSDVNYGFDEDQLLITYTGKKSSLGVIYITNSIQNRDEILTVNVTNRTRSIVVLGKNHFCATTEYRIVVLDENGLTKARHDRKFPDKGGLMMSDYSDEVARFFYGDGDEYIGCQWDGKNVNEIFRFIDPRMIFPRGSVIDGSGEIIVCCESKNIFRISPDGKQSEVIVSDETEPFGDIDFHPNGKVFITTFWEENELPILFKIEAK